MCSAFSCINSLLWAHHVRALKKIFKIEVLTRLENAILTLSLVSNSHLLIFQAESTENVLDIL